MADRRVAAVTEDPRPHWQGAERDEALIRLANDGLTATRIMAEFAGKPSRSAIIGRVHRLQKRGFKVSLSGGGHGNSGPRGRAKPPKEPRAPKPSARTEASAGWRGASNAHHNDIKGRAEQRAASPGLKPELIAGTPLPATARALTSVAPVSRRLALVALAVGDCKWPQGDPMHPDFHFCGEATDGIYCNYHARIAYVPAAERRRSAQERNGRGKST